MADDRERLLIGFSSHKGGVGKSTMAIGLAAHLSKNGAVALVDADVIGTDLDLIVLPDSAGKRTRHPKSVLHVIQFLPEVQATEPESPTPLITDFGEWLKLPTTTAGTILVIPSWPEGMALRTKEHWRTVLEQGGSHVRFRMRRLFSELLRQGFDIVVDLPAFHVGFAYEVNAAIGDAEGTVFEVVGADLRDVHRVPLEKLTRIVWNGGSEKKPTHSISDARPSVLSAAIETLYGRSVLRVKFDDHVRDATTISAAFTGGQDAFAAISNATASEMEKVKNRVVDDRKREREEAERELADSVKDGAAGAEATTTATTQSRGKTPKKTASRRTKPASR